MTQVEADIGSILARFDGKDLALIKDTAKRRAPDAAVISVALNAIKEGDDCLCRGATTLLKCWFDQGLRFDDSQSRELIRRWSGELPWQSHVHLLQMLEGMAIHADQKALVHRLLMRDLGQANKFVRAWAYGGLAVLANGFHEYREEADAILDMAMRDETAAVKARIRIARDRYPVS